MSRLNLPPFNHLGKLALGLAFVGAFSLKSYSQKPDRATTVAFINGLMKPQAELTVRNGSFFVDFYDEGGDKIRQDWTKIVDLELDVRYEAESNLIVMPCSQGSGGCIERELKNLKIKRLYDRLSVPAGGPENAARLLIAWQHLIRLESQMKYKDEITLD